MTLESATSASLLLEEDLEKHHRTHTWRPKWRVRVVYCLHILILVANLNLFAALWMHERANINECSAQLSTHSPAIEAVTEFVDRYFDGAFYTENVFKGTPNKELDEAWDNITTLDLFRLSEQDVRRMGKDPQFIVKFPPGSGDDSRPYAGSLEVFHQLHCLNTIREYIYQDYYAEFKEIHNLELLHMDHCIDILRQVLLCNADVGMVTFNWVTLMEHPTPDFSTRHRCRNFDAVSEWAMHHTSGVKKLYRADNIDTVVFPGYPTGEMLEYYEK